MSLFNCIPNECARVVYREYEKGAGIRYRYPGEDWISIDGDDFSIEEQQDYGQWYVFCNAISNTFSNPGCDVPVTLISRNRFYGKLIHAEITVTEVPLNGTVLEFPYFQITRELPDGSQIENELALTYSRSIGTADSGTTRITDACEIGALKVQRNSFSNFYAADRFRNTNPYLTNTCLFKVFKNGAVVHEETRDDCPEVEQTNDGCQLSEITKELKIDKLGYLERVEVRNQQIESGYIGAVPYLIANDIPENMLIVYKALTTAPVGLSEYVSVPGFVNPWQQVAIIQSAEDCPPPEFEVLCDCDCRSCPDGTCVIECGDHVCCNDTSTGRLIDSIPIEEYCEVEQ